MEQITTNIDVLNTIFNYLPLSEQINATHVCPEFQYVVVDCMWPSKYRHIKVYKLNGDSIIINTNLKSREDNGNGAPLREQFVSLTNKEFQQFLQLNQENIEELELSDYRSDDREEDSMEFIINNQWKFIKLKMLTLVYVTLDVKHLEMIYENCQNLQNLQLKQCCNTNGQLITLSDQQNYEYDVLIQLVKMLKEFHMDYREMQFSDCSLNLHDLLSENNLKSLNLNVPLKNLRYKEILKIGNFNEFKSLQKFTRLYLNSFQNLINLTLEGSLNKIFLDSQFIQNLSETCPLIKYLNFKRCLINVDDFSLLSSILEITLDNCMSLTWRNLRQLLELPLLQKFHSNYSTYTREFENVFIPFNLTTLTLVGNDFRFAQIFDNPKQQLTNLKHLIYFDGSDNKISHLSEKFPNLETLHILAHHVELEDLFHLPYLKCFKVPKYQKSPCKYLQLMYLLKHPSLRDLALKGVGDNFVNESSINLFNIKRINLSCLEIDFDLFNYLFEFLFDLLQCNSKLKIIVTSDEIADFQYYFKLVSNRKFCRHFIKLCGFKIDCSDFTKQPDMVQRKLELINELSEFKNVYFII